MTDNDRKPLDPRYVRLLETILLGIEDMYSKVPHGPWKRTIDPPVESTDRRGITGSVISVMTNYNTDGTDSPCPVILMTVGEDGMVYSQTFVDLITTVPLMVATMRELLNMLKEVTCND
jgi:hypothetical protein